MDGFSEHNQMRMHLDYQEKMAFMKEWGVFVVVMVMMFGLKTVLATFQHIIMKIFSEYILAYMQVFLDDVVMYSKQVEHLSHVGICLEKC